MRAIRAFRGACGNAGGNSNPGDQTKDPLGLYGVARQSDEKVIGPIAKVDQQ